MEAMLYEAMLDGPPRPHAVELDGLIKSCMVHSMGIQGYGRWSLVGRQGHTRLYGHMMWVLPPLVATQILVCSNTWSHILIAYDWIDMVESKVTIWWLCRSYWWYEWPLGNLDCVMSPFATSIKPLRLPSLRCSRVEWATKEVMPLASINSGLIDTRSPQLPAIQASLTKTFGFRLPNTKGLWCCLLLTFSSSSVDSDELPISSPLVSMTKVLSSKERVVHPNEDCSFKNESIGWCGSIIYRHGLSIYT